MLSKINAVRKHGCFCGGVYYGAVPPLLWHDSLYVAALYHTRWMHENYNLSHTGYNNSSPADRANAAGFKSNSIGENIAWGHHTFEIALDGWLKSAGHCQNIMYKKHRYVAVAHSGTFWCMILGAPEH